MPFFWLFVCISIAFFTKSDKRRKLFIKVALFILIIFGNIYFVSKIMRWWEPKPVEMSKMEVYDVAIVLGGGIINEYKKPFDRVHFDPSADRLLQAFQLYKAGKVKKILISAGSIAFFAKNKLKNEAMLSKDYLILSGVPETDILIETKSTNTFENALFSKEILVDAKLENSKLLLITSAYHMKRSLLCFAKQNLKTECFPVCYKQMNISLLSFNTIVPDEEAFALWYDLFHEWYGLLTYKIMGYI